MTSQELRGTESGSRQLDLGTQSPQSEGHDTAGPPAAIRGPLRGIAVAAVLITLGNIVSRLLGLVREQTIAALLGTTAQASVYGAANRVPTMVYDLLIGGAISAALVPVFSEHAARDERRAGAYTELSRLAGAVLGLALLTLVPLVALLIILARPLMAVLGVGFEPEVQELGVHLVRLSLPAVVLMGAAAVLMAVLYALHRVSLPSYSAAVYNLGIVIAGVVLFPWLGVTSLVIGVLAGALGQVLLQMPGLRGVPLRPRIDLRDPGVRRILHLYAPVAAGLVVSAMVVMLDTRLASLTGAGSLAAMRYATTLIQFPLGLVATALSFASLPVLARYGASGARAAGFRRTFGMAFKAALLLVTPAMVAMIVLREPIVRLIYQRGALTIEGARLTAEALLFYAPQLPFVAVDQLLIAAFYAIQNTRTPVLIGVAAAGIYVVTALTTVDALGMRGLVLANTLQHSGHALILLALLWRASGGLSAEGLGAAVARIGFAALAMAAVLTIMLLSMPPPESAMALAGYLAIAGAVSGAAYLLALLACRSEELAYIRSLTRARFSRAQGIAP